MVLTVDRYCACSQTTDDLQPPQWSPPPRAQPWPYGRPASYHRRKRPALEEEEEGRGRATWPSRDGRRREEAEERVLRPVGSADDLEVGTTTTHLI